VGLPRDWYDVTLWPSADRDDIVRAAARAGPYKVHAGAPAADASCASDGRSGAGPSRGRAGAPTGPASSRLQQPEQAWAGPAGRGQQQQAETGPPGVQAGALMGPASSTLHQQQPGQGGAEERVCVREQAGAPLALTRAQLEALRERLQLMLDAEARAATS
jgi:hypothetical protein